LKNKSALILHFLKRKLENKDRTPPKVNRAIGMKSGELGIYKKKKIILK
jgi:hypothetical protein